VTETQSPVLESTSMGHCFLPRASSTTSASGSLPRSPPRLTSPRDCERPKRPLWQSKGSPPGDWPPSISMPSSHLLSPLPHPELWHRYLQTHSPHDKKALRLLAPNPEVDNQLLLIYPFRHPGHLSLLPATRPPHCLQVPPGLPPGAVLPPGDQPVYCTPPTLW